MTETAKIGVFIWPFMKQFYEVEGFWNLAWIEEILVFSSFPT